MLPIASVATSVYTLVLAICGVVLVTRRHRAAQHPKATRFAASLTPARVIMLSVSTVMVTTALGLAVLIFGRGKIDPMIGVLLLGAAVGWAYLAARAVRRLH